jgi:DNA-binding CsgD family transcriptional regulator
VNDADTLRRPDAVLADRDPPVLSCVAHVRGRPDGTEALILAHFASGLTDEATAEALGISLGKVRWATRSVIAKLGALNRPHAVARAVLMGYLELEDALTGRARSERSGEPSG